MKFPLKAKNCPICKLNPELEDCICPIDRTGQEHGKINVDKVIQGQLDNKSNRQIAIDAGSRATSPQALSHVVPRVMARDEYKKKVKTIIQRMEGIRESQLSALEEMNPKAIDYDRLVNSLDKLTKTINLLSGEATERHEVNETDVSDFLNIS